MLNMIERGWGPLTRALTGITLSAEPEHDENSPNVGSESDELADVMDSAMEKLCGIWDGIQCNEFPVTCKFIPCHDKGIFTSLSNFLYY